MPTTRSRKNIRLQGYDYSQNGAYFVTICSRNRECMFGKINVGAGLASALSAQIQHVELTKIGQIIEKQWRDIPNQFENVDSDEFVIMPNHIHGILIQYGLPTRADARPAPTTSDIICSLKSKCTVEYLNHIKRHNLNASGKIWQRGYFDHIIRDEQSLQNIRAYIVNNPMTWNDDENNLRHDNTISSA